MERKLGSNHSHLSLLSLIDAESRERMFAAGSWVHVKAGEAVCREGEAGSELYLVLNGRMQVTVESLEGARTLAVLERGDFFGEMALLSNQRRNATVSAVGAADLLRIDRVLALELFLANRRLREQLGRAAVSRAEEMVERLAA